MESSNHCYGRSTSSVSRRQQLVHGRQPYPDRSWKLLGLDVLILDVALAASGTLAFARTGTRGHCWIKPKQAYLTHMTHDFDHDSVNRQLRRMLNWRTTGSVSISRDRLKHDREFAAFAIDSRSTTKHLLAHWHGLNEEERRLLLEEIAALDLEVVLSFQERDKVYEVPAGISRPRAVEASSTPATARGEQMP